MQAFVMLKIKKWSQEQEKAIIQQQYFMATSEILGLAQSLFFLVQ
jgi:hypothetical protein